MNEQQRYDQLDAAIDAIFARREPGVTGDADLDSLARLASGLRGLPAPDFEARLVRQLLPQAARRPWLSFLRRNTMTTRIQDIIRRPRVAAPLAFATAAAVAAVIAVLIVNPFGERAGQDTVGTIPTPGGLPEQAFGALPEPTVVGGKGGGGGEPIPGASGAITYTLAPDLSLPASALAYRLARVTPERVQEIAQKLGFTETLEPLTADIAGTIFGYRVASARACPADLPPPPPDTPKDVYEAKHCTESARVFQMELDGFVLFQDSTVPVATAGPSEAQAIAAARQWLLLTGLPGDDPFAITVDEAIPGSGLRQVTFEPAELPASLAFLVLDRSQIVVSVAGDGSVFHANGYWPSIEADSVYGLHTAEQLLTNLRNLRGEFNFLLSGSASVAGKEQPTVPPDTLQDAVATVESVQVYYRRGVAADGQAYLMPFFVARGHLTQENLSEPFPFGTWVPATGPTAGPPEIPQPLAELIAVRDTLPLPSGATIGQQFPAIGPEGLVGLVVGYTVQDTPEAVLRFYRQELPAEGWQAEEPPVSRAASRVADAPQEDFHSFVKGDVRVVIAASPSKDPSGGTVFTVVVERRGPLGQVTETLNIRSQPTTESEVAGTLKKGDIVELLEQVEGQEAEPGSGNTTWHRIPQGYIYSAYVTKP